MPRQVIRRLRHAVLCQIVGRGANSLVHFTQCPGAEGRIRQPSANAQGNIETGRHHVQYPVVQRQFHLQLRVALHKRRQQRRQHREAERERRIDPQRAGDLLRAGGNRLLQRVELAEQTTGFW